MGLLPFPSGMQQFGDYFNIIEGRGHDKGDDAVFLHVVFSIHRSRLPPR